MNLRSIGPAFVLAALSLGPAAFAQDFSDSSIAYFGCSIVGCRDLAKPDRSFLIIGSPMPHRDLLRAKGLSDAARIVLEEYRGVVWILEGRSRVPVRCVTGLAFGDRLGQVVGSLPDLDGDGVEEGFACADTIDRERGHVVVFSPVTGKTLHVISTPLPRGHASLSACRLDGPGNGWRIALGAPLGAQEPRGRSSVSIVGPEGLLAVFPSLSITDRFGHCLANCGDLDGDGVDDLAIGAPLATVEGVGAGAGAVHIVSGADGKRLRELRGLSPAGRFGYSIASSRPSEPDMERELLVGVPGHGRNTGSYGAVRKFGLQDGRELAEWTAGWGGFDEDFTPDPASVRFGAAVVDAGDVDLDGCPDIAVAGVPTVEYRRSGSGERRWGHALLASSRDHGAIMAERFQFEEDPFIASASTAHVRRSLHIVRVPDQGGDGRDDVIVSDAHGLEMKGGITLFLTSPRGLHQEGVELSESPRWLARIGR